MTATTRGRLARLHRWTALSLFPVYVALLASGMILATHPMTHPRGRDTSAAPVDTARLNSLLRQIDTVNGNVDAVEVERDGHTVNLFAGAAVHSHDLITGADGPQTPPPPSDFYDVVRRIHSNLWIGAGFLVTLATFGMFFLIIAGPILSRPRRTSRTPLNWHVNAGWLLYPLLLILPLSATVMTLPVGRRLHWPHRERAISLTEALALARDSVDLTKLHFAGRMPNGAGVFLVTDGRWGISRHLVRASSVDPLGGSTVEFARMIHEGEWGGAWSGALNFLSALGLLAVLSAGVLSWWRRRKPVAVAIDERLQRSAVNRTINAESPRAEARRVTSTSPPSTRP